MKCVNCGEPISPNQKFCGYCGTNQGANQSDSNLEQEVDTSELKSIIRTYHSKADQIEKISNIVTDFLKNKNLETQQIREKNTIIVQAKQPQNNLLMKTAKKALGLEAAATISFTLKTNDLVVKIGSAKWLDKGVGMAVAWFLFWPAAITSVWGIYSQKQLFKKIDELCIKHLE